MYGYRRRRRWTFWFMVWFFGTLGVMVVGLAVQQLISPSPVQPCCAVSVGPSSSSAAPVPSQSAGSPALTGPLQAVQGSQQINGVELGFPHSTVGAVSAADADATEVLSTLDPDRAAEVMRMVADPSWTGAQQQAAEGAVNDRKDLGIPATGPVPDGTSVQTEPAEYQVRDVTPGTVLVLLLCDVAMTTPGQGTTTEVAAFPFRMHWSGGDWKVQSVPVSNAYLKLAVEPDSPQAAAAGWQQLEPAGG